MSPYAFMDMVSALNVGLGTYKEQSWMRESEEPSFLDEDYILSVINSKSCYIIILWIKLTVMAYAS